MPLTWNIGDVDDFEQIKSDEEWPVTEALIFATMAVGIHHITESTVDEFVRRLSMWQEVAGGMLWQYGENWFITEDDVRRRIGMSTNASSRTKTEFKNMILEHIEDNAKSKLRTQSSRLEKAKAKAYADQAHRESWPTDDKSKPVMPEPTDCGRPGGFTDECSDCAEIAMKRSMQDA